TPKRMSVRPPDERVRMGRAGAAMEMLPPGAVEVDVANGVSRSSVCGCEASACSWRAPTGQETQPGRETQQGSATTHVKRALPLSPEGHQSPSIPQQAVHGALESAVDVDEDARNGRAKQNQRGDNHDGDQGNDQGILYEALATAAAAGKHVHRKILQTQATI